MSDSPISERHGSRSRRPIAFHRRTLAAAACLAIALSGAAACSNNKPKPSGPLPDAATLMSQSETAMSNVQTVHFEFLVDGTLPNVPLSKAVADLKQNGDAKGTATITELGVNVAIDFVIVNKLFYIKGATGGFTQAPASQVSGIIDPSAILDPNRGVVQLMKTAQNPKVEGTDSINGHDAYRVAVTPDPTALGAIVPGAGSGTTGKIWIDVKTKRLDKCVFTLPANGGNKGATVTILLSNYDAPVTVDVPPTS